MLIASADTWITRGVLNAARLIGIVAASLALIPAVCPGASVGNPPVPPPRRIAPVRTSIAPAQPLRSGKKQLSKPGKSDGGLTPEESKQLSEAMKRLTPDERKRVAKAVKGLSPEGRKQLTQALKGQLSAKGKGSPAIQRAR
jgi:hypothetical protein